MRTSSVRSRWRIRGTSCLTGSVTMMRRARCIGVCDMPLFRQAKHCVCRDRVHQVAYLRNPIAHSPQPSLAEGVAGVAAMAEVLKDHGEDAAAAEMEVLLDRVRYASWLGAGVDVLLLSIQVVV